MVVMEQQFTGNQNIMADSHSIVNLKLFIDSKSNRVIFAEAQKNLVDFIFNILSLPLASVYKLVRHEGAVGNLYKSIENLGSDYIEQGHDKNLLNPKAPERTSNSILFLQLDKQTPNSFYRCSYCNGHDLYDYSITNCPSCKRETMTRLNLKQDPQGPSCNGGVFVKGSVIYMVTDDLVVKPLSTQSTIDLLQKFDIKDMCQLQQKDVNMGMNEAVKMLKACMHSNNILTEVFLTPEVENNNNFTAAKGVYI